MKKVATSKQSVFDDPLFCPGDSFATRDSDEYIAPSVRTPAPELVNTLTISDEDAFRTAAKPMKTTRTKPMPTPQPVAVAETVVKEKEKEKEVIKTEKPKPVQQVTKPKVTQSVDPLKSSSVFDTEGEDLFLPSDQKQKKKESNFEEELFGQSASSAPSNLRAVNLGEKNLRLGTHDSDSDNEIEDLGVGAMMEREVLDFDLFGKSSIRQYEPMQTDNDASTSQNNEAENTSGSGKIRKDDLVLESNDILSDFESFVSVKETKKSSIVSSNDGLFASTEAKSVVVDNSYDIDAYISQQEEDGGGGLFD